MAQQELAALLLTTEPEVRYFTGFLTRFWASPTRPWFLIIPAAGRPAAVIPSIGEMLMRQTWIDDIRTWSAPDLTDDGVGLLANTLRELTSDSERIGVPDGHETHVRMPLADFEALRGALGNRRIASDGGLVRRLRMVKSNAEVAKIQTACDIAGRAFERVQLSDVYRRFQMLCLEEGADWVAYLAGGAEQGGYADVISPARDTPLAKGDTLMLDTGLVWDGYFCDFDRNWSIGPQCDPVRTAYGALIEATNAAFDIARPGRTASELFHSMHDVLSRKGGITDGGRLGHGLGMSLTEWPSIIRTDHTVLEPGMVLTLEPGIAIGDKLLVHEEDILVTDGAPRFLSPRAAVEMPEL